MASCWVIEPKAIAPFIRFCGDFVDNNFWVETGHYPIPNFLRSLEKIVGFPIKLDFDLVNAYHQFPLAELTSKRLSVQTPWGQYEPIFLPEGVGPAAFVLQSAMDKILGEFDDWFISIFDNLLVLATDYDDAYQKVNRILDRCLEYNLFLKFSKTWLGFEEANFYGYVCKRDSYELSDDRKKAIEAIDPPGSCKQTQSLLGSGLFFKSRVPHYATLVVAPLTDMTKNTFILDSNV